MISIILIVSAMTLASVVYNSLWQRISWRSVHLCMGGGRGGIIKLHDSDSNTR